MKKIAFSLLALCLPLSASAVTLDHFDCKTTKAIEGRGQTRIQFIIADLEGKRPEPKQYPGLEEGLGFKITPNSQASLVDLDSNMSFSVTKEQMKIVGDSAGLQYTTLVLYRNADFNRGYVQVKGVANGGPGYSLYSTLTCTHVRQ